MHSLFSNTHQQSVLAKYKKQISRLKKAIREGSFSRFSADKKRQLFQCLARYERQLRQWGIAGIVGAALLMPGQYVTAQTPVPVGGEFRVNTYTTSFQNNISVAMDSDGDFVIVWQSFNQDGSSYSIYAQRYNNTGAAQGAEFRVNTYTTSNQRDPSVAMDSDGDFVVVWRSFQDGSGDGIYAQRYDNTGAAQGAEFRVNTYTTNYQLRPSVAIDSDGDFVVTWESYQDGNGYGIYPRRYYNTGAAQGDEFRVNTYTTNNQLRPSVAIDSDGDFVVIWESYQDGSGYGIYAQRYNNTGTVQGAEFRVNTYTTSEQSFLGVSMDSDGDFMVAWNSPQDGSSYGIYAQRYNNTGAAQGAEFRVNTYTINNQQRPSVAMDSDGDFMVAWMSYQDGSASGIYAQRYDNTGAAQGAEFRVNTYTTSQQRYPAVAMDSDGNFVVAWEDSGQEGSQGIYAQRFISPPLLPIELLFFTGHAEPAANIVEWVTATEKNSAWQIVERSANGAEDWMEIGRMAGAGNSTAPCAYKISDENPLPLGYYRLTSVDFDGSLQHSEVISIQRQAAELSIGNIFPVPAEKEVSLVVNMPSSGIVDVTVHNTLGQLVYRQKSSLVKGSNELKIDLRSVPAGNYTVTIADGYSRVVQQVVKK